MMRTIAAEIGALVFQGGKVLLFIALAVAVEVHDDPTLRTRGWLLIAAMFLLGMAITAFHRHATGLRFYPGRLRLRLALEEALFRANQMMRGDGDRLALVQGLRSIQCQAPRTVFGDRIANLTRSLASDEPEAAKAVAAELAAIVRELAAANGKRYPLRRIGMLPDEWILPASVAIAVLGAAIGLLSPGTPLWSLSRVLEAILWFSAANAALALIRLISHKIHDIRSKAGFRTILVTDKQGLTGMGAAAAALLYWRIGHLVIVFGEGEPEQGGSAGPPGAYCFFIGRHELADALTACADHADLIVLDTADETLAREVQALTTLPPARYLALSADGSAPPGYRWIDPRTLFILPSDRRARRRDGDPYGWGIRRGRRPWEDAQVLIYLIAAALLVSVERGVPLALFLGMAAICQILPDFLGPRRRASISRSMLRVPQAPEASRRLHPQRLERWLWVGTGLLGLSACAYLVPPLELAWDGRRDPSFLKLAGAVCLALFAGRSVVFAGLVLRKWTADWHFRMLVLRRNARTFGYGHKAFVLATCGKYAQVILLRDHSLDRTDDDYGEWRESSLGSWFPIFSEINAALQPDAFLHAWQRQVLIELETVDFAVFDWIEDVTDNMRWELGAALDRLPPHRLLIICHPDNEAALAAFLDGRIPPGAEGPRSLLVSRGRDDEYIWSSHDEFDRAFAGSLHQALVALVVEPRSTQLREAPGAWAYPRKADEQASATSEGRHTM